MIKSFDSKVFGGKLNVEIYHSANQVVEDINNRSITDSSFDRNHYSSRSFVGATRDEAMTMLREGYQPTVDALKSKMKFSARGVSKRTQFYNDVAGFAPVVPNAILGLPQSMVNSKTKPIKTKVIDVYYEMTASCSTSSEDIIKAGKKMLSAIVELEAQGYRFNLYVIQDYYRDGEGCDMLCVRVKTASQPFDLKRMSFPMSHTAFFRGIGFDWYARFPIGKYRSGYGKSISYEKSQEVIQEEIKKLFGKSAVYFAATQLMKDDTSEDYIKGVLVNE